MATFQHNTKPSDLRFYLSQTEAPPHIEVAGPLDITARVHSDGCSSASLRPRTPGRIVRYREGQRTACREM